MKGAFCFACLLLSALFPGAPAARAQDATKAPTAEEMAASETERLEKALKLEDWQLFYVDSTLQSDFRGMQEEIRQMQEAKVGNYNLYLEIQDKWFEKTEKSFKRYFSEGQWKKFVKSAMARGHRDSYRRRQKAAKKAADGK